MSVQVALRLLCWRGWATARSAGRPCRSGYSTRRPTYVAGVEQRIQRGHAAMSGYAALTRPTWLAWSNAFSEAMQQCRVTLR